ncbi:MAG: DUF2934 domain-containing protein [Nibricoccus sp.]
MSTLTHEKIAHEAQQIWQQWGCPAGRDTEIWLEAERKLKDEPTPDSFVARSRAEAAAESEVENLLSPPQSEQKSIQAAMQKEDARAPKTPRQSAPKPKPAEVGKPLWDRPRSAGSATQKRSA